MISATVRGMPSPSQAARHPAIPDLHATRECGRKPFGRVQTLRSQAALNDAIRLRHGACFGRARHERTPKTTVLRIRQPPLRAGPGSLARSTARIAPAGDDLRSFARSHARRDAARGRRRNRNRRGRPHQRAANPRGREGSRQVAGHHPRDWLGGERRAAALPGDAPRAICVAALVERDAESRWSASIDRPLASSATPSTRPWVTGSPKRP